MGMPRGCPLPTSLREITSFSKKTLIFRKSLQICGQSTAKAKAKDTACCQGGGEILQKKKKRRVGCRILIGVIEANLNFSSGLMDVKLFCSELFKS